MTETTSCNLVTVEIFKTKYFISFKIARFQKALFEKSKHLGYFVFVFSVNVGMKSKSL